MIKEISAHKMKMPRKPARKPRPGRRGIANATINDAMAILHQGNHRPPTNARSAVKIIAIKNFMCK